jgi:hypothetical protein
MFAYVSGAMDLTLYLTLNQSFNIHVFHISVNLQEHVRQKHKANGQWRRVLPVRYENHLHTNSKGIPVTDRGDVCFQ